MLKHRILVFKFDFKLDLIQMAIENDDFMIQSFNKPERKDRPGDSHGGVMLYVKEGIHYKRRYDLELRNIENIWIEVANSHKRVLIGLFYRPPNSDAAYLSSIEDSVGLATDTGISDIITGDFNLNVNNHNTLKKKSRRSVLSFLCISLLMNQHTLQNIPHL